VGRLNLYLFSNIIALISLLHSTCFVSIWNLAIIKSITQTYMYAVKETYLPI